MVLADGDRPRVIELVRQLGVVAVHEVDRLAIRSQDDAVGAVLAAAIALADELGLVELVVAIGVRQAPQALVGHLIVHQVKAAKGVEQSVGTAEGFAAGAVRKRQRLHLGLLLFPDRGQGDAIDAAVLVAGDESALVVLGHCHPGAFLGLGHRVEEFHGKARYDLDAFTFENGCATATARQGLAPWLRSVGRDLHGRLEILAPGRGGRPVGSRLDHGLFPVHGLDFQRRHEPGHGTFIPRVEAQFVVTCLEELAEIDLRRLSPIGVLPDLGSIEVGGRAVVTGEGKLGGEDRLVDLECFTEGRLFSVLGGFADPDPLGHRVQGQREKGEPQHGGKRRRGKETFHGFRRKSAAVE